MTTPERQSLMQEQLGKTEKNGILRLNSKDKPALREAAESLGLRFYSVNLQGAANVPGFVKAFKGDLDFPNLFGNTLDALYDCLTDFSWHAAPGYVITISGNEKLRANPSSFAVLNEVLASAAEEWQRRNIPFWVFYETEEKYPADAAKRPPHPKP